MEWFFLGLRYAIFLLPFIFVFLFALFGFWLVIAAGSRATVGAWVVGGAFLIETAFVSAPAIPIGISVSSDDVAFLFLVAALIIRILFFELPRRGAVYGIWLAIGVIFFVSLAMGLLEYGSKAGVESRANFYFWMAGLYFASFSYPPEVLKKLWRITQWCAWGIVALVIYRWVGLKFGFVSERLVEFAGARSEFRVIGSNPTFFLAVIGAAYFAMWLRHSQRIALAATVFMLGLVLVLQHRSVWVVMMGALAVVAWHEWAALRAKIFPIIGMGVLMIGLMGSLIVLNPSSRLTESIARSVISVTEPRGTHTDRIEGWRELLGDYAAFSPHQWLIGKPYGTGYERYVRGQIKEYSPHNFYLQLLLRLGAVGLLLFILAHFELRRCVLASVPTDSTDATLQAVLLAVLVANLLYYIPYQGFYLQGVFYGVLIGYLAAYPNPVVARPFSTSALHLSDSR